MNTHQSITLLSKESVNESFWCSNKNKENKQESFGFLNKGSANEGSINKEGLNERSVNKSFGFTPLHQPCNQTLKTPPAFSPGFQNSILDCLSSCPAYFGDGFRALGYYSITNGSLGNENIKNGQCLICLN